MTTNSFQAEPISFIDIFFCGAAAQRRQGSHHSWGF